MVSKVMRRQASVNRLTSHLTATVTTAPKISSDDHTTAAIPPPATRSRFTPRIPQQSIIPQLSHRSLPTTHLTPATTLNRRTWLRLTARRARDLQITHSRADHTLGVTTDVHMVARMEDTMQLTHPPRVLREVRLLLFRVRAEVLSLRWVS